MNSTATAFFLAGVLLFVTACEERQVMRETRTVLSGERWAGPLQRALRDSIPKSLRRSGKAKSVICIDTSGSIGALDLEQFIQHIDAAARELDSEPTILIGDTEIDWEGTYQGPETFEPGSPASDAAIWQGRGGTDFRDLIRRAVELEPEAIIYLTDGYGLMPETIPEQEIIWVVNVPCTTRKYQDYIHTPEALDLIQLDRQRCEAMKEFGPVISILDPCAEDAMTGEDCQP